MTDIKTKDKVKPEDKLGICFCSFCGVQGIYYSENGEIKTTMICQNTAHKEFWYGIEFNKMEKFL